MWDELILPPFIPCLFQRSSLISASAFAECAGSMRFTEREERERDRIGEKGETVRPKG